AICGASRRVVGLRPTPQQGLCPCTPLPFVSKGSENKSALRAGLLSVQHNFYIIQPDFSRI
ncbi:MAG: hypothetical protein K2G32_01890, partial [Oscillospiraceae bacterium]|nr:hypothetical protein [Oscillospiraceae bacterium]